MALVSDKRGSNDQRTLFNWTRELYPSSKVHYEYALPDGSRIDIFIPVFGIAIEYDGKQHYKYVEHFHKDISGYIEGIKKDAGKDTWCEEHGIKVIRIRADDMLSSKEELEQIAMNHEAVKEFIEGKTVRKVIAVPDKLVNIVAN